MRAARSSEGALTRRAQAADETCNGGIAPPLPATAPDLHQGGGQLKRAAIYVRVSTTNRTRGGDGFEQNPEVQEVPLRQLVQQRGWTLARVYSDPLSGAKKDRPGLGSLMNDARRGLFDVVLVWRFDRFAR
jgi:hypothetical protein